MRRGRKTTQLTAEQEKNILEDYQSHMPVREIFRKYSIPMNRLYDLLRIYDIPKRGGLNLPVIGESGEELDVSGMYQTQDIAGELDLTKSQVRQISYLLNNRGYPLKKIKKGSTEVRVYDEQDVNIMTQIAYEIQEKKLSTEKAVVKVLKNNQDLIQNEEEEEPMFHEGDVPEYRPEMKPAPISEEKAVHDEVILLIIQKILDRCTRGDISAQTALMKVRIATELLD
jgi:hypothetical protein